jgi:tetratricopeptide (TPR) repeat protein
MWTLLVIGLAAAWVVHQLRQMPTSPTRSVTTRKPVSPRLSQAIAYADRLWQEKRYIPAEKAYLQVLKLDHKNAQAYTRLGMIYTRQKNFEDAKESFVMASRIEPSANTWHNLGLAYLEAKNNIKAVAAFEKAVVFEATAERYLNLAKAHQKLSNWPQAIAAIERAVELQPTIDHLWILANAYKAARLPLRATETYQRILSLDPSDRRALEAVSSS